MQVILSELPIYVSSLMGKVKYEELMGKVNYEEWDPPQEGGCDAGGVENGILMRELEKVMVMAMAMVMVMGMGNFHHCQVSVEVQTRDELA